MRIARRVQFAGVRTFVRDVRHTLDLVDVSRQVITDINDVMCAMHRRARNRFAD